MIQPDAASGPARPDRARPMIAAMLVSTFMAAVEVTVISTAMPAIVERLGGFSLFSWAFGIYVLTQAVTTPLYGRLADDYGRKRVFLGSTLLFLAGSLLCGCAWSMGSLIVFRAVQGIGGGGLVPLAITIIGDVSKPADRPRMLGYVSGIWGISAIVGPLLGAFFVESLGWPFVFWLNLPVGAIVIAMVLRFLHEPAPVTGRTPIDLPSAAVLVLGVGAVMAVLVQLNDLSGLQIAGLLTFGAAMLAILAWRERSAAQPLLAAHLLRRPIIAAADASGVLCGALVIGTTAFLPTWVQGVAGGSTLEAGLVLGVLTVTWTIASMSIGRVMGRFATRTLAVTGSLPMIAGAVGLCLMPAGSPLAWLVLCCILMGAGLGLTSLVFTVAVQSGVARQDRGRATALFYFSRLMGQALGSAAFGGVLNAGVGATGDGRHGVSDLIGAPRAGLAPDEIQRLTGVLAHGLRGVFVLAALLTVAALAVALCVPRHVSTDH